MNFNLETLKQEFIQYMERIGKSGEISAKDFLQSPSSVFLMSADFKDFLTNEKKLKPEDISTSIGRILKQNIKDGQIVTTDRNSRRKTGMISDLINDLLKQDKVKKTVDINGDGSLSQEEITNFLNAISEFDSNNPDISIQDIFDVTDAIEDGTFKIDTGAIEAEPKEEATGGTSDSSHSTQDSSNTNPNSNDTDTNSPKTIESMSDEELQTQLKTSQSGLQENQAKLEGLISGSDSTLQSMQKDIDTAYNTYNEELTKVDEKLAKQLDTDKQAVADKEKEISEKEKEISSQETTLSDAKTSYENAQATTSSLKSRKSELEIEKSKGDEDGRIEKLLNEQEAKKKMDDAETKLKELKEENEELKNGEDGLTKKKEKLAETEKEILEAHPELQELQTAYETAQKAYDEYKASEISKTQEAVNASQAEIDKINNEINKRSRNTMLSKYNTSELKGKYNYNDKTYNTVMDQAELDKLVRNAANGGAGTKYGHPDTCLSIAQTYGLWATGDSKRAFNNSGVWRYGDGGAYKEFANDSKEVVMAKIKEELDAGRPVVLHVNGKSDHSRHYVTVLGYSSTAGSNLQESDLLIWDSYASTIRDCGNSKGRHMITGYDTGRTGKKGYGYQLYVRKT